MWLLEVFNVVYKGYTKLKPNQQMGTIKVNDGIHEHYLYKVSKTEKRKPSIQHHDEVVLSGPNTGSISATRSLTFDVNLFCGAYKDSFTLYDCPDNTSIEKCAPLEKKFISKDGRGEIYVLYAIFDNATEAHIEVKFFTDDGYNPEVYGVVAK